MNTTQIPRPTAVDTSTDIHLTGPYAPVTAEVDVTDLPVEGELPADLDGAYLRNGPNPRFSPVGSYTYPLDGDGMLHRVEISGGRARYTNRFVRSPMLVKEEEVGHAIWPGLLSPWRPDADEVGPHLAGTVRDLPDINVVRHGGRLLALAEFTLPYRMSPQLETVGPETFDGTLPAGICAHPKIDPATGEMIAFHYNLQPPFLTWTTIDRDGTATAPRPVEGVERPVMIHDMAITPRFVVLVLSPLFFDVAAAMRGGSMLAWEPETGTRIALVPRDGGPVRWCDDETFWLWHTVNAFEAKDSADAAADVVVLEYAEWAKPSGITAGPSGTPRMTRAILDPAAGTVRRETVSDLNVDFPRIDDRLLGREHPVSAFALRTSRPTPHPGVRDGLAWHDARTGAMSRWEPADVAVGEPAFAPDPRSDDPGSGWWLAFTSTFGTGESALVVLPASDPASGPVATVRMPVRVPLGLHGNWLPSV
ncbi:carotenoid cleavage dioxygenase [Pseudonocardia sulfidoxydans NBRC 16205]|uniref:Dioxygenase n=1 Tax=Pseudonocardia sulfidoxydans NBRC 16205 TaxID=1223511 RepID=A0A511DHC1_9PSEU|nr:carotenoid oxygenase family protein [Pseudonocardia sulfidoxydans]GEL22388.1 carotenoid cleavage dioxygenase [Pseudonocardia sulfidoxydans NBRC 16205]